MTPADLPDARDAAAPDQAQSHPAAGDAPSPDAVRAALDRVTGSAPFRGRTRSIALLRFVVEETLAGRADRLKEYTLGAEALGRGVGFDGATDPIVRAEASRLRERLSRYYADEGRGDAVRIELPKGSYVPRFVRADGPADAPAGESADVLANVPPLSDDASGGAMRAPTRRVAAMLVAGLVVSASLWGAARAFGPRATEGPDARRSDARFEIALASALPAGSRVGAHVSPDFVITRDGSRLVTVVTDANGIAHLHVRRLAEGRATRLTGTAGARAPFVSPDGRWVGFHADGYVKKVPLDGGAPVVLCEAADLLGASWGDDGEIVLAFNPSGRLWRVSERGGTPRVLVDLGDERLAAVWPRHLPGGEHVLYTVLTGSGADRASIEMASLRSGARTELLRGGTFARLLADDVLGFVNQGTLYAMAFEPARGRVIGSPVPIFSTVQYSPTFGFAQFDVSESGLALLRRAPGNGAIGLARVSRDGTVSPLPVPAGRHSWLRLAPSGDRLAVSTAESGAMGLWVGAPTGALRRVRGPVRDFSGPTWWPDGRGLFVGGLHGLQWMAIGDDATPQPLGRDTSRVQVPWTLARGESGSWRLAYHELDPRTGFDLWMVTVRETNDGVELADPERYRATAAFEVFPALSPDGRWMAYGSNESGRPEVYVRRVPDDGTVVQVSRDGGRIPLWSPVRSELVYQDLVQQVHVVPFRVADGAIAFDAPRRWTRSPLADVGVFPSFDLGADGDHLVVLAPATAADDPLPDQATLLVGVDVLARRMLGERR